MVPIAAAAAGNVATEMEAPQVDVVGTTPLPGIGTPLEEIPSNVQIVTDHELAGRRPCRASNRF